MPIHAAMTKDQMQRLSIQAVEMQRRALHLCRWAYLNERGAFEFRDASALLRLSIERLDAVSDAVLLALPQYHGRFEARRVLGLRVA